MKRIVLLTIALTFSVITYSQTIKVQGGISLSTLDAKSGVINDLWSQTMVGYSALVGIDYFNHKMYNLSSNIGIVRKGGKDKLKYVDRDHTPSGEETVIAWLDYVTINTTADIKFPVKENWKPFISVGPRLDILASAGDDFKKLVKSDDMNKVTYGFNVGAGVNREIKKFVIGIRGDYYFNLNKAAEWDRRSGSAPLNQGEVQAKQGVINLQVGYKL